MSRQGRKTRREGNDASSIPIASCIGKLPVLHQQQGAQVHVITHRVMRLSASSWMAKAQRPAVGCTGLSIRSSLLTCKLQYQHLQLIVLQQTELQLSK
eukprot:394092-Pelagomonas_calceolata.AAC.4